MNDKSYYLEAMPMAVELCGGEWLWQRAHDVILIGWLKLIWKLKATIVMYMYVDGQ